MMSCLRIAICLLVVGACCASVPDRYSTPDASPTLNTWPKKSYRSATTHKNYKRITPLLFAYRTEEDNETSVCSSSMDDFPPFFNKQQLKHGAFIPAIFIGIYCFTLLAIVCDNYFLPSVKRICEVLNLSEDVAGATFMSVATSCPEMFTNVIGTFLTESDIGIGTVVGSAMYQSLGVASVGGLFAPYPIQLDWWPVTRDCFIYVIAVSLLVFITWDGQIYWYEALVLFIVYFLYFSIMFQNKRISKFVQRLVEGNKVEEEKTPDVIVVKEKEAEVDNNNDAPVQKYVAASVDAEKKEEEEEEEEYSLWRIPKGGFWKKVFFFYTWPIKLVLMCTMPDPVKYPKLFPVTFVCCIFWIGTNSYVVSWMLTIIGFVFGIPDLVLGLTFLAAGSGLPESLSMAIVASKGEGGIGVSNALGANTMNILFSLGMPWFLKTASMGFNSTSFIQIDSGSIEYTILALIAVVTCLYSVLYFLKFRLSKKLGAILLTIYAVFLVLATLSETVFFPTEGCDVLS